MTAPLVFPLGTEDAFPIVNNAYDKWSGVALQAFSQAQMYAGQLANIPLTPVTFDATFNPQIALSGFPNVGPAPVVPTSINFMSPGQPSTPPPLPAPVYNPDSAPVFTGTAPVYMPPAPPVIAPLTQPGDAPTLTPPVVPNAPSIAMPNLPALASVQVPDLPVFDMPTFTAHAPVLDIPIPNGDFSFVPAPFNDDMLATLKTTIGEMLQGDFILPTATIDAIRARAYRAIDFEESRSVDEAYTEFAARGFAEPPGQLNARVIQARNTATLARSDANRDIYIQDQQTAVENLRAAIQGGLQLEGSLMQLQVQQNELELNAARYALDVTIQIFQARIGLYNASLQTFTIQAQVYRDQLQGVLAQAQIYETEMRGAQIRGELNLQQVEMYNAQIRGVQTLVDVYTAQVQGAEAAARVNLAVIQGYTARVQAFSAEVGAQVAQWDGYKAQVQAQLGTVQYYQTAVNAYDSRVRAWATGEQVKQTVGEFQLKVNDQSLAAWKSTLDLFQTQVGAELDRVRAVTAAFGSQVDAYKASAEIATASAAFDERRFQLNLAQEQAIVDTSLKRSEASFEQMKFFTTMLAELKRTLATVQAQLAASAMNAVNVGATVSSGGNQSVSWATGVSISESGTDF